MTFFENAIIVLGTAGVIFMFIGVMHLGAINRWLNRADWRDEKRFQNALVEKIGEQKDKIMPEGARPLTPESVKNTIEGPIEKYNKGAFDTPMVITGDDIVEGR